jgi:ATP-dependent DNA helicase RecG
MNKKELELILKEGEGYKIEFKETIGGIDKDLVAFANSSGGRVLLGVMDAGEVKGIKITNRLRSQIQDIANNCRPQIKVLFDQSENILIVNVREGTDKPYACSSGFCKRIGPISQKMTRDEIIEFIKSEGKIRFDELPEPKFSYPIDFDKKKLLSFLELAGLTKSVKPETILVNLGAAEKQEGKFYFNNAGVLLFAKEPQKFIPWSVFTVALFKDKNGVDVIDRKEISGNLFEIVEQVMDFVKLYSKVAYRFTGKPQRENIYEYPFEAVREAVINSVIHKYYFERGHNNILRFLPDRIRIENYWQKPQHFKLGRTVFRRNPLLVDLFARIHFGEKLGTGMQRMKDYCKSESAPYPIIEYTDTHFYIVFKQNREYLKMARKEETIILNDRQRKFIEALKKRKSLTRIDYEIITETSKRTAIRDLQDLARKGIIVDISTSTTDPNRRYKLA